MRKKLIALVKRAITDWEHGDVSERIADHLISNGVRLETKQATSDENKRWIPVTDRLPDDYSDVLAYKKDEYESRIFPAHYDHGIWYDCILHANISTVTHWMPVPEPPKED